MHANKEYRHGGEREENSRLYRKFPKDASLGDYLTNGSPPFNTGDYFTQTESFCEDYILPETWTKFK
jgi:hypothetical protein